MSTLKSEKPENLCDFIDDMGSEEHLNQWLAARDARMRREGATEAWEEMRRQAQEVGLEPGIRAKLLRIVAEECAGQSERLKAEG